jgi:hypothetical protein
MFEKTCKWHTCTEPVERSSADFCNKKCKNKYFVDKRRKKIKQMAIEYKGGKCICCDYSGCAAAMDFHHLDPSQKEFGIAASGHCRAWERVKVELDKCILVCKVCHAEIEDGYRQLPGAYD